MLEANKNMLYHAFISKDGRFDGRFFVGISSTKIYCRPVCRARKPKIEHCTFFATATEAEQGGYRPCLLCRPELAPGAAPVDATISLARRAARLLEANCGNGQTLAELASSLGCSDRHLRRAFTTEYNVSPVQYLQTCRLLLAKNLLTDSDLSILDVAMTAGFGSLRRFNQLFKERYRLAPSSLRQQQNKGRERSDEITLALGYRPPYRWDQILQFLADRIIPGVEKVEAEAYYRTVHDITADHKHVYGWVRVNNRPEKNVLSVTIEVSLLPVLAAVLARIRHLFDLSCDPNAVAAGLSAMNQIHSGLCQVGTRLPGCFDTFEMTVRAVLGQQVTIKAAHTLAARLVATYGTPIQTGIAGLTHTFPTPADIIALDEPISDRLGPLGITGVRCKTILALAQAHHQNSIDFGLSAQPNIEIKKLLAIPGIGNWTAQYIAMRSMGWPDAFPATDAGIKKALAPLTSTEILNIAEEWRPWRSYATINLWNSL